MHAMEYYTALKRKGILSPATKGMNLEDLRLSNISQSQKDKLFHLFKVSQAVKFIERIEWWLPEDRGRGKRGTGIEFQVCKGKRCCNLFYHSVNILNTTELYT